MIRQFSVFALALVVLTGSGCKDSNQPKAVTIKGTVTVDGKLLPEGEIYFVAPGQAPKTLPIKDGAYSGPAFVGNNRVEIRAYKKGPPLTTDPKKEPTKVNYIPERFSNQSKLTAEVTESNSNELKFEIASR